MIAILTKWLPATGTKPTRIKAYTNDSPQHSITISEPKDISADIDKHRHAAETLQRLYSWDKTLGLVGGSNGSEGYVFVQVPYVDTSKFLTGGR